MNPLKMTGLDLLQAMMEGKLPYPSMADTVPMRIKSNLPQTGRCDRIVGSSASRQ